MMSIVAYTTKGYIQMEERSREKHKLIQQTKRREVTM